MRVWMDDDCTPVYANASLLCRVPLANVTVQCLADDEASGIFGDYLVFWRCAVCIVLNKTREFIQSSLLVALHDGWHINTEDR